MGRIDEQASVTVILEAAIEEIRRHGAETYPDECCGALIERDGRIVEAFRLPFLDANLGQQVSFHAWNSKPPGRARPKVHRLGQPCVTLNW